MPLATIAAMAIALPPAASIAPALPATTSIATADRAMGGKAVSLETIKARASAFAQMAFCAILLLAQILETAMEEVAASMTEVLDTMLLIDENSSVSRPSNASV